MHARHDHVQLSQQSILLIKTTVLEDVDFDALQAAKRRHGLIEIGDDGHLLAQPISTQPTCHLQPRRMISNGAVFMTEARAVIIISSSGLPHRTTRSDSGDRP